MVEKETLARKLERAKEASDAAIEEIKQRSVLDFFAFLTDSEESGDPDCEESDTALGA